MWNGVDVGVGVGVHCVVSRGGHLEWLHRDETLKGSGAPRKPSGALLIVPVVKLCHTMSPA